VAWTETGRFHAGWFVLTVLGVTANHVALNLTDDHFDDRAAVDGSDHGANPYAGGNGVLTSGSLSPGQVRAAFRAGYAVTALCGGVLTWAGGWPVAAFAAGGIAGSGAVGPAAELLGVVGVAYLPAGMVVFRPRTT
jgi:1,4-dihydroxy-2-naphthoate octaprenyltransferase